jgi:hypothetical protein
MHSNRQKVWAAAVAFLAACIFAQADIVETKSGARLTGTVTKVDAGSITLETVYAGTITIKQSEVARFETEKPLVIRLAGGTTMEGIVSATSDGKITINGQDGTINTTVDNVATTWAPGGVDPAIAQMMRKWKYEISLDVSGKTGNSEELGYGGGARATLADPEDILQFYTQFNYKRVNGVKSDDKFAMGVDYASYLSDQVTWYARDEGGYDNGKDIDFYNVAAVGLGYDFIKNAPKQMLTGRAGLSYRFEDYGNPLNEDVRSAGLDLGLNHVYRFENALLSNSITFVPSFDDFANYRAVHDSSFEVPVAGNWKFRIGMNNDYTSKPSPGVDKLDTTYYGRFVLNWE